MRLFLRVEWPIHCDVEVGYDLRQEVVDQNTDHVEIDEDSAIIVGAFGANNRVLDFQRYVIHQNGTVQRQPDTHPDGAGHIVFLLESPHKDEFGDRGNDVNCPIAPAQGHTGRQMDNRLQRIFQEINAPRLFHEVDMPSLNVIVSNPIEFQASLYFVIKRIDRYQRRKLTDAVWTALWSVEQIRNLFETRIVNYSPCLIINACTKNLRGFVDECLLDALPDVERWKSNHPASWRCSRYRRMWQNDGHRVEF